MSLGLVIAIGDAWSAPATLRWPHTTIGGWLRLRAKLQPAVAAAFTRALAVAAAALCLSAAFAPAFGAAGSRVHALRCAAGPTDAAAHLGALAPRGLLAMLLAGAAFDATFHIALHLLCICYTQPIALSAPVPVRVPAGRPRAAPPPIAAPAPPAPPVTAPPTTESEAAAVCHRLIHAVHAEGPPLTQHLAFLHVAILSERDASLRAALFTADRGAAWPDVLSALIMPIEALAVALGSARRQRAALRAPPAGGTFAATGGAGASAGGGALGRRVGRLYRDVAMRAIWAEMFGAYRLVIHAAHSVSGLLLASAAEDALGTVELSGSLRTALSSMLGCLKAIEAFCGGDGPAGPADAPPGSAIPAASPRRPQSQQAAALHVAQQVASTARSHEQARAAAIEAALHRSIHALIGRFGAVDGG